MSFFDFNTYFKIGEKMTALICFHGLLSTKNDFSFISKELAGDYDTIVAYDLPGHGENNLKFNSKNIKLFVTQIYDSLRRQYDTIDVIGYSMGGVIACYLQSIRKIRKMILLAPAYRYLNLKNYHFSKKERSLHQESSVTSLLPKKNYFHIIRFTKIISDLSDEFKMIYPQTLIIWGNDDFLVKEESGKILYQMVVDRNRQFVILKHHNHFNICFSNVVVNIIKDFLRE